MGKRGGRSRKRGKLEYTGVDVPMSCFFWEGGWEYASLLVSYHCLMGGWHGKISFSPG